MYSQTKKVFPSGKTFYNSFNIFYDKVEVNFVNFDFKFDAFFL